MLQSLLSGGGVVCQVSPVASPTSGMGGGGGDAGTEVVPGYNIPFSAGGEVLTSKGLAGN
jgi:hypothetical protein